MLKYDKEVIGRGISTAGTRKNTKSRAEKRKRGRAKTDSEVKEKFGDEQTGVLGYPDSSQSVLFYLAAVVEKGIELVGVAVFPHLSVVVSPLDLSGAATLELCKMNPTALWVSHVNY